MGRPWDRCSQTRKDLRMKPTVDVEAAYPIGDQADGKKYQRPGRASEAARGPVRVMSEVHDDEETRDDTGNR